jgi:hypothetical protein
MKDPLEDLEFDKGLFRFVKSLQEIAGMDDEEAATFYYIIDMWDKKRYRPNEQYKLANKKQTRSNK